MGWVARSLALGQGFSSPFSPPTGYTALVPPAYPALLAAVFHLFGVYSSSSAIAILSLNSLFSALTSIPIYFAARRALGDRIATLAVCAWIIYPFSIYFSAAIVWDYGLTALLFATCFAWAQVLPVERRISVWIGFGALYGLTALSNPSVLSMLPVLLGLAVFRTDFNPPGKRLRYPFAALLATLLVLTPWTLRNEIRMHAVFPVRDGFWLEFWAGNNGNTSESNLASAHPASSPVEMRQFRSVGEMTYLAQRRDLAVHHVMRHPVAFAGVSLRRAFRFWTGLWSLSPGYLRQQPLDLPNLFFCTTVTWLMLQGLMIWRRQHSGGALPYQLLLLLFPLPYYLTHASMDYRQPIEPEIVLLVTVGIFGLPSSHQSRKGFRVQEEVEADTIAG